MHEQFLESAINRDISPLTLFVSRSLEVRSGSEELMRLLPRRRSGSRRTPSRLSILIESGTEILESALERVFRGATEDVEDVVLRGIGSARISLMPLRDIDGKSDGAVVLVYPGRRRPAEPPRDLDAVDSIYEVDLQTGAIRVLTRGDRADPVAPGLLAPTIEAWEGILHPWDRDRVIHARKALVEEGSPLDEVYRVRSGGETYEWIHDRCVRVEDAEGSLYQICLTRPSAEESHQAILPREDDRYLLDATQELVAYLEPDLRIRWANKAAATSAGMAARDLTGRRCYEIWHGRQAACEDCPVVRAVESLSPEQGEITTPDGRRFFIRSYPITDSVGALVGLLEFGQDITQQHRTEEALRRTAGLLESILENSPHPMSVLDAEGNYVMVNRATTELYSLPRETMIGHHLSEFLPQDTGSLFDRRVRRVVKEKRAVTVEDEVGAGDEVGVFYTTLFPIWGDDGEIAAIGGITTDVTDLKAAQELAERADSQKASLLAAVHSKVRDDLAVISSLIDANLRPSMEPETVELLRRTQIQLRALSLLHEQSDATETLGAVDLVVYAQSLVDEVVHSYGCTGSVSLSLWADPIVVPLDFGLSFGLVLTELVANVCRNAFVPRRGGLLEIAISDDDRGVTLRVTDSSPGTQEIREDDETGGTVVETLVANLRGTVERNPGSFRAWTVLLPLPPEDRMGA